MTIVQSFRKIGPQLHFRSPPIHTTRLGVRRSLLFHMCRLFTGERIGVALCAGSSTKAYTHTLMRINDSQLVVIPIPTRGNDAPCSTVAQVHVFTSQNSHTVWSLGVNGIARRGSTYDCNSHFAYTKRNYLKQACRVAGKLESLGRYICVSARRY